jgi:excinuclease ABC subunit A
LNRRSATLSGGESQRIRLSSQIGSGLMGMLYVLDEPSIGLHPKDNAKMIETLKRLRDLGNTVIVVEHDADTIRAADHILEIGPGPGAHGGKIVAQGPLKKILRDDNSLTGQYLSGKRTIGIPGRRRPASGKSIVVRGARQNNLKNIRVEIPLQQFVCVTGASGSGKSSLIHAIVQKRLYSLLHDSRVLAGEHDELTGSEHISDVIDIDQSPIGRSSRSNPATYIGFYDAIRTLFAETDDAGQRDFTASTFSFNVKGGRCEACQGDGVIKVEMHFLPDVYVPCDVCKGQRYNRETLEIRYRGKNIHEVLEMTVEDALRFFQNVPAVATKLQTLTDVGLSYVRLGQNATTLSGGEAQRVKLSRELAKRATGRTLYILDEPTTGLHFYDVAQLLDVLHRLRDEGNTIVVIEHNLDVIKTADWLIDLGPEGGEGGGEIIAAGTPEQIAATERSHTGTYLKPLLEKHKPEAARKAG